MLIVNFSFFLKKQFIFILLLYCKLLSISFASTSFEDVHPTSPYLESTIQVVIPVHPYNKLAYLPYMLSSLEFQIYPKNRIKLHLITERIFYDESYYELESKTAFDFNSADDLFEILDDRIRQNEETISLLKFWARKNRQFYNELELTISNVKLNEKLFGDSTDGGHNQYWNKDRFKFIIDTKNQELYNAYQSWADFVLFCDADVILVDRYTISNLTDLFDKSNDIVVVAPMLYSLGTYSNFWAGMDARGYYRRTDDYIPILERKKIGTFSVPMIHTLFIVDMRKKKSRRLSFDPSEVEDSDSPLPFDDIIAFAKSAKNGEIDLYIDNRFVRGYIPPASSDMSSKTFSKLKQTLIELELDSLLEGSEFPISPSLESYIEPLQYPPDRLSVDEVYVINLRRRPERRRRMEKSLNLLGIRARFWDASDGKQLTQQFLDKHKIKLLDGYVDPFHRRLMTFGEIGCFLSHYRIWDDARKRNLSKIIILEDDVKFESNFREKWIETLHRFEKLESPPYDFLYLGRKLNGDHTKEVQVDDGYFVEPGYSYWTIGYMITREGIRKLLNANPLSHLIPVDEFLPLMYSAHTNETLMKMYPRIERLHALSLRYLIVSPTHYVGDAQYVSDTEDSDKVSDKNVANELFEFSTDPYSASSEFDDSSKSSDNNNDKPVNMLHLVPQPPPLSSGPSLPTHSYVNHLEL